MGDNAKTGNVLHVHADKVSLNGLEAGTVIIDAKKANIKDSMIGTANIGRADNAAGATANTDPDSSSKEPANEDIFESEDWTKLSGTIFMFNKAALHPKTEVYDGKQKHVTGRFRKVVVKLLKKSEHYAREIDILLKLTDHPNIVKIIDSGEFQGAVPQIFIVMERCVQNLDEYIKKNSFNLWKATHFFKQTVSAIVFIHSNYITHRDLKPRLSLIHI